MPLWRKLAAHAGLSLRVHFFSDHSIRGKEDAGFKVPVAWDVPLLQGYDHSFLSRTADFTAKVGPVEGPTVDGQESQVIGIGEHFRGRGNEVLAMSTCMEMNDDE